MFERTLRPSRLDVLKVDDLIGIALDLDLQTLSKVRRIPNFSHGTSDNGEYARTMGGPRSRETRLAQNSAVSFGATIRIMYRALPQFASRVSASTRKYSGLNGWDIAVSLSVEITNS